MSAHISALRCVRSASTALQPLAWSSSLHAGGAGSVAVPSSSPSAFHCLSAPLSHSTALARSTGGAGRRLCSPVSDRRVGCPALPSPSADLGSRAASGHTCSPFSLPPPSSSSTSSPSRTPSSGQPSSPSSSLAPAVLIRVAAFGLWQWQWQRQWQCSCSPSSSSSSSPFRCCSSAVRSSPPFFRRLFPSPSPSVAQHSVSCSSPPSTGAARAQRLLSDPSSSRTPALAAAASSWPSCTSSDHPHTLLLLLQGGAGNPPPWPCSPHSSSSPSRGSRSRTLHPAGHCPSFLLLLVQRSLLSLPPARAQLLLLLFLLFPFAAGRRSCLRQRPLGSAHAGQGGAERSSCADSTRIRLTVGVSSLRLVGGFVVRPRLRLALLRTLRVVPRPQPSGVGELCLVFPDLSLLSFLFLLLIFAVPPSSLARGGRCGLPLCAQAGPLLARSGLHHSAIQRRQWQRRALYSTPPQPASRSAGSPLPLLLHLLLPLVLRLSLPAVAAALLLVVLFPGLPPLLLLHTLRRLSLLLLCSSAASRSSHVGLPPSSLLPPAAGEVEKGQREGGAQACLGCSRTAAAARPLPALRAHCEARTPGRTLLAAAERTRRTPPALPRSRTRTLPAILRPPHAERWRW